MDKQEIIDLIKLHYPNHTTEIQDVKLIGDNMIMLIGKPMSQPSHLNHTKKVIYEIVDDKVFIYKSDSTIDNSELSKWKSILRGIKLSELV
jgi:hypothetical protein